MIEVITGDLLEAKEKYICHQTNCLSKYAAGIAYHIFKKYPYADVYFNRASPSTPGDIDIKGNGINERFIINLMGQYNPGSYTEDHIDDEIARQEYFGQGLIKIAKIPALESIAFPAGIGCGLANGNWNYYYQMLESFANTVNKIQKTKVYIYKLKDCLFKVPPSNTTDSP